MKAKALHNNNQDNNQNNLSSQDFIRHLHAVEPLSRSTQPIVEQNLRKSVTEQVRKGNYAEAVTILTELIELEPDNANNYNNRGLIYFKNGQYAQALADYNRALSLNPRLDSAYNNRANYYASQGDLAAAITDYELALDFNPGNLRASINQAIAFRQLGLYDLAIENLDIALILGRRLKGRIYLERGRTHHLHGDWNYAIADYKRALESLPNHSTNQRHRQQVEDWLNELLQPVSA